LFWGRELQLHLHPLSRDFFGGDDQLHLHPLEGLRCGGGASTLFSPPLEGVDGVGNPREGVKMELELPPKEVPRFPLFTP